MEDDLMQFQDGDETMIGEKGATLSGGQRLRISLARAIYQDRQLIIFDDPLSALDAHVGKFIFKETICKYLSTKTIILVTHALYFAKDFDYIYLFNAFNFCKPSCRRASAMTNKKHLAWCRV